MFKYQRLGDLLQKLKHQKCQLKELIYNQSEGNSKINPAVAYSNLSLILNNWDKFERMFQQLRKRCKHHHITNKNLLFVMVAEQINVGKIVGGGQLKRIIMENQDLMPQLDVSSKFNKNAVQVRVRQLPPNDETRKWNELFASFQADPFVPGMYHFTYPEYSRMLADHPQLRTTPACVVQSFSSALPPCLLFKGIEQHLGKCKGLDVIDACSAPGNKTLQLGEYIGSKGTVYAFQKDERRFKTLSHNIQKHEANNIEPILGSFLDASPQDPKFRKVKLILLDPSCSGSGMLTNFTRDGCNDGPADQSQSFKQFAKTKYDSLSEEEQNRVLALKKFQLQLLNHAAQFKPQRISYSTCSIYEEQNERVVEAFLAENEEYCIKKVREKVEGLQGGLGKGYSGCVRVDPRSRRSDGFFVCVFGLKKVRPQE